MEILINTLCVPSTRELPGHGACALQLLQPRTVHVYVLRGCVFILCLNCL